MKLEREILGAKIYSGIEIDDLCKDITFLILEFVRSSYGVNSKSLQELDNWLIETEKNDAGISGSIRTFFKKSDAVKEKIINSNFVNIFSKKYSEEFILHDIVRLRTVISGVGYTISRPHQDIALWKHDAHAVNIWLPLVDVDKDLSPIKVYSDINNIFNHFTNEYNQQEIFKNEIENLSSSIITIKAGEILTFSPTQIHHSIENSTDRIRWSVDFRLKRKNV